MYKNAVALRKKSHRVNGPLLACLGAKICKLSFKRYLTFQRHHVIEMNDFSRIYSRLISPTLNFWLKSQFLCRSCWFRLDWDLRSGIFRWINLEKTLIWKFSFKRIVFLQVQYLVKNVLDVVKHFFSKCELLFADILYFDKIFNRLFDYCKNTNKKRLQSRVNYLSNGCPRYHGNMVPLPKWRPVIICITKRKKEAFPDRCMLHKMCRGGFSNGQIWKSPGEFLHVGRRREVPMWVAGMGVS